MKTIISDRDGACRHCAEILCGLLAEKSDAVIAFSIGENYNAFFRILRDLYSDGKLDLSRAKILSCAEFVSEKIMGKALESELLSAVNIDKNHVFLLNEENFAEYDELIASLGGIDLLILDIGENARIGFNDLGTAFSSLTHSRVLTKSVLESMSRLFPNIQSLPESGVTLGIRTITQAKNIALLALGENKADSVYKMLYGRNDPATPAAFLQIPMNVTVILDEGASSKL